MSVVAYADSRYEVYCNCNANWHEDIEYHGRENISCVAALKPCNHCHQFKWIILTQPLDENSIEAQVF